MTNKTVCIEREYGSNGKNVAQWLAKTLSLECYDKKDLWRIAEENHLLKEIPEDENEHDLAAQREAILYLSDRASCVFVGTSAASVLQGRPRNLNVFIKADLETKIQWAMANEKLDRAQAEERIAQMGEQRVEIRKNHSTTEDGDPVEFDLTVSTSKFGMEGAVEIIKKCLSRM